MPEFEVAPPRSWGRSTVHTACPLDCPDCCSLDVTVERGRITKIDAGPNAPSTNGYICGKVRGFGRRVYHEARLMHPAVRRGRKGRADFERLLTGAGFRLERILPTAGMQVIVEGRAI